MDKPALASGSGETHAPDPVSRSPACYPWATLIARLFERFPLTFCYCISTQAEGPLCGRFQTLTDDIRYVRCWPGAALRRTAPDGPVSWQSGLSIAASIRSDRARSFPDC